MKFLMGLLFLYACSGDKLPKVSKLDRLRVIAMVSDLPEINSAGGSVVITPWLSDPEGGTRTFDIFWAACPDPGIAYGKEPTCEGVTETQIAGVALASQERSEALTNLFTVNVPAGLTSLASAKDQFNGVYYLVTLRVVSGDEIERAYKRIRVSSKTGGDLNTNPTITALSFDGALPTFPSQKDKVQATIGAGAETFEYINGDGDLLSRDEEISISFFTTSGELKPSIVGAGETSVLKLKNNPTTLTVIGVIRDQRGGIGVYKEEF
jgi:hypothetical protein